MLRIIWFLIAQWGPRRPACWNIGSRFRYRSSYPTKTDTILLINVFLNTSRLPPVDGMEQPEYVTQTTSVGYTGIRNSSKRTLLYSWLMYQKTTHSLDYDVDCTNWPCFVFFVNCDFSNKRVTSCLVINAYTIFYQCCGSGCTLKFKFFRKNI